MNTKTLLLASALVSSSAVAQINSFKVQNLWNNNTGVFTYSGTYPALTMTCSNQNNTTLNTFGERFVGWLSADGGATQALIDGHKDFSLFFTVRLTVDAAAARPVEAGLLMKYDNHRGFEPESQFYCKVTRTGIPVPVVQTSADWVMPAYDFMAEHNVTFTMGQTVLMGIEYDYNDADPMQSMQRLTFGEFQSPWINGNWGGPIYDPEMKLGMYFQPLVEAANPTHTSTAEFNLVSFAGTVLNAAQTLQPESFNIVDGYDFTGDLASLVSSDDNKLSMFNDEISLMTTVDVTSTATSILTPSNIMVRVEHSVDRPGMAVSLALKNHTTNNFAVYYGAVGQSADVVSDFNTANAQYISGTGRLVVRAQWMPINDEDPAQDGWLHHVDQVSFQVNP
ncbi:MAG TPA: hypothetical protein PKA27_13910 [Fimbriimonadaceae bacterium]|nr:hypothetical protein [Fimbriimonadaceae bacterium]